MTFLWNVTCSSVITGMRGNSTATVKLMGPDGVERNMSASGKDPENAVFKAIDQIVGVKVVIKEYSVFKHSSQGDDVLAYTWVVIESLDEGLGLARTFSGLGSENNAIVSTAIAYISALNKLLWHSKRSTEHETVQALCSPEPAPAQAPIQMPPPSKTTPSKTPTAVPEPEAPQATTIPSTTSTSTSSLPFPLISDKHSKLNTKLDDNPKKKNFSAALLSVSTNEKESKQNEVRESKQARFTSPLASSTPASLEDNASFWDKVKPIDSTMWRCAACMVSTNKQESSECASCGTDKPIPTSTTAAWPSSMFGDPNVWKCTTCRVYNKKDAPVCIFCNKDKPTSTTPTPSPTFGRNLAPQAFAPDPGTFGMQTQDIPPSFGGGHNAPPSASIIPPTAPGPGFSIGTSDTSQRTLAATRGRGRRLIKSKQPPPPSP